MDITIFLAQMWGPTILAVGLGILLSGKYYAQLYRDLEKQTLAMLVFGMIAIAGGIAHVSFHNVWGTVPEIVISLLGWGFIFKGLLFIIIPSFVDRVGDWEADSKLVPFAGAITVFVGAYVSWIGFFT